MEATQDGITPDVPERQHKAQASRLTLVYCNSHQHQSSHDSVAKRISRDRLVLNANLAAVVAHKVADPQ